MNSNANFSSVDLLAAKFHVAQSIAITIAANIGHDLFDHQLDFVHAGDGKARILRLAAANSVQCATASIVGASVRAVVTGAAMAVTRSPYTAAAGGRDRRQRFAHRGKDLQHHVEAADLENFLDGRLQTGEHHFAALLAASFRRDHQNAQARRCSYS